MEHDNTYGLACDSDECEACQVEAANSYDYTCPHEGCHVMFVAKYDDPPQKCPACEKPLTWWPTRE